MKERMIYQFVQCENPTKVCELLKELSETYKTFEIVSITASMHYWWVFYRVGKRIKSNG